ncbi:MAG: DNA primase [Bacteroidota bacterium]
MKLRIGSSRRKNYLCLKSEHLISNQTIQLVKDAMDIEEVVSDFVTLKRSGSTYKALSPFTNEKTPSFYVVPSKGIFKDFSSGKGGDAITFVMEVDGLSYTEAIKYLAAKYGIEIKEEEQTDEALEEQNKRESLRIVLNFAKEYFSDLLINSEEGKSIGLSYFKERGFTDHQIKKFELGYSLNKWDGFLKVALENAYNEELLEKAGLLVVKDAEKRYDRFRGRVIFPIHNVSGKVVAFGARTLKKDDKPKYLNSPESEVYHKSKVLYGLYQAKQGIRQNDNCYLVEGYTDVISLHQSDIENVVASSGTSLTADQIKLISRFSSNITVLFDGDKAGIRASLRGIDMILESGMNVRVVMFPEGEDPDSYSRKLGTSEFKKYLTDNVQDFIAFKLGLYSADAERDPLLRAEAIKEVVQSISIIPDPIKRAVYLKDSANRLDMDESVLIAELNKLLIGKRKSQPKENLNVQEVSFPSEPDTATKSHTDLIHIQERETIRLLLNYGRQELEEDYLLYHYLLEELSDIEFNTPIFKEIFSLFQEEHNKGRVVDSKDLIRNGSSAVKKEVIDLTTERREVSPVWEDKYKIHVPHEKDFLDHTVYQNITRLKRTIVQRLIEENKENLKGVTDHSEVERLIDIQQRLKDSEMELSKVLGVVIPR